MNLIERIAKLEEQVGRLQARARIYYAKSSYTPTYTGGTTAGVTTYSLQQGQYFQIGKVVFVTGAVAWTNATGTGNARISLPFAGASGINQTGSLRLVNVTFANSTPQIEFASTAYFEMRSPLTNAGGTVVQMEVAGNIIFTIVYMVD